MTGAIAPDSVATAPQERGWRWFVVALALMFAITAAPLWPPTFAPVAALLRLLFPIEQFALLVFVAIASCAVVGWWVGGQGWVALLWVAASGWTVWGTLFDTPGYGAFVRGWTLVLGASFGLVCLATQARPFLGRALAAVALAVAVLAAGIATRSPSDGGTFDNAAQMVSAEYRHRLDGSMQSWHRRTESAVWQRFATSVPDAASRADRTMSATAVLVDPSNGSGVFRSFGGGPLFVLAPALLGLESLLALALGWAAYHRLSRVRIGPPIAALRELRFSDQLVWGLIVGATLLVLPTFVEWRAAGINFVCFFGTLYALRGAGVLTWWISDRLAMVALLALVILIPLLGPVWVLAIVLTTTFGLGLGDTWRDFRVGTRRPTSLP